MFDRPSRLKRNGALLVLGLLVLWFGWSIRAVLNPLLVGYLLAYILHPVVMRIRGGRLSHRAAVNLTFAVGGLLVLLVALGVVVQMRALVHDIATDEEFSSRIEQKLSESGIVQEWLGGEDLKEILRELPATLRAFYAQNEERVDAVGRAAAGKLGGLWGAVRSAVAAIFGVSGMLVLVPLYTYFLLFELERVHGFVLRYLPRRHRARIARVGEQVGEVLASFFRGRLLVCLLKGGLITAGLALAGIPYAFLLGMGSGLLSLIPLFGPFVGFALALLLGLLEHSFVSSLVRTAIVFGVAEILEGYVLIPKVIGDALGLHPVVVLFALLAGGAAFGLLGVLIALPLTAAIVILAKEFVLPSLERFADEESGGTIVLPDAEHGRR